MGVIWWQIMDENLNEIAYCADGLNYWDVRRIAILAGNEKGLKTVEITKNIGDNIVNTWVIDLSSQKINPKAKYSYYAACLGI